MTDFQLGDRVKLSGTIRKTWTVTRTFRTIYVECGLPFDYTGPWTNPRVIYDQGTVVGKRSFQTGSTSYGSWDDNRTFRADGAVTCYQVAFHLRRKPVLCLPSQLTLIDDADD